MARWASRIILVAAPLAAALLVSTTVCNPRWPGLRDATTPTPTPTVEVHWHPPADVIRETAMACAPLLGPDLWQWHDKVMWTPDALQILFNSGPRLYAVGSDGVQLRTLADASADIKLPGIVVGPMTSFDVSPDGRQVVYSTCEFPRIVPGVDASPPDYVDDYEYELAVASLDDPEPRRITRDDHFDNYPAWSPDGKRIAFVWKTTAGIDFAARLNLYSTATDGSDRRLEASSIANRPPQWSPDSKRIAYVRFEGANRTDPAIYTIQAGGRKVTRVTDAVSGPSWSPDGSRIAFAKADGDEVALYTIAADGTDARRLTAIHRGWQPRYGDPDPNKAWIHTVEWSPVGGHILYKCDSLSICVVDTEGVRVGRSKVGVAGDDVVAAWSPDGELIAVAGTHTLVAVSAASGAVIYIMAPDGTDVQVLVLRDAYGGLEARRPAE